MKKLSDLEYEQVNLIKDWVGEHRFDMKILNDFQGEMQDKYAVSSVALLILFPQVTEQSHSDNEPFIEWYNGSKSKLLRPRFKQADLSPHKWPYYARLLFAQFIFSEFPATDSGEEIDLVMIPWIERVIEVVDKSKQFVPEFVNLPDAWIKGVLDNYKGKRREGPSLYTKHESKISSTDVYWRLKKSNESLEPPIIYLASTWIRQIKGLHIQDDLAELSMISDRLFLDDFIVEFLARIAIYCEPFVQEFESPPVDALIFMMIQILENEERNSVTKESVLGKASKFIKVASDIVSYEIRSTLIDHNPIAMDVTLINDTNERRYQQFKSTPTGETGRILP